MSNPLNLADMAQMSNAPYAPHLDAKGNNRLGKYLHPPKKAATTVAPVPTAPNTHKAKMTAAGKTAKSTSLRSLLGNYGLKD